MVRTNEAEAGMEMSWDGAPDRVRIAVLEDDPVIRAHLTAAVSDQPELLLVASAGSLAEAEAIPASSRSQRRMH